MFPRLFVSASVLITYTLVSKALKLNFNSCL